MRPLVVIPTYNERKSLPLTLASLDRECPGITVLIVDDNSPDGTGRWAQKYAHDRPHIHVLHRKHKQGLGPAYLAGFRWALRQDFTHIIKMDADSSHRAEDLPRLLRAARDADVVIGSRWVPGGGVHNWPWYRILLSRGATSLTRISLGLPIRDATAGFRVYRAQVLRDIDFGEVTSQGYCFQIDMAWKAYRNGATVREVPILFIERTDGESKMSASIVAEALWRVCAWGVEHRLGKIRAVLDQKRRRPSSRKPPGRRNE